MVLSVPLAFAGHGVVDHFPDPAAAWPVLFDVHGSFVGSYLPGGIAAMLFPMSRCGEWVVSLPMIGRQPGS